MLVPTRRFERELARFRDAHPELRRKTAQVLRDLETDPFQPHLRLHALKGELEGLQAVRITYSYRMVIIVRVRDGEIDLLGIGSHDEMYR